jgi:hypothetical protein
MRDLHNNLDFKRGISPAAAGTDNTAYNTQVLDMQGLDSAELVILTGTNTDTNATFSVAAKESDVNTFCGEETDVDDADMLGTEADAGFTFSDDNKVFKLGFRGHTGKRYRRVTITPVGNDSGNIYLAAVWVTSPTQTPTANPPV